MDNKKFNILLLSACLLGYLWLAFAIQINTKTYKNDISVCIIKHTTNIPCPSCGTTRSILSLIKGDVYGALFWNPIGLIILTIMIVLPIWISYDLIKRKSSLYIIYNRLEIFLKQKSILIPAILLIAGNWIWNIYKGL